MKAAATLSPKSGGFHQSEAEEARRQTFVWRLSFYGNYSGAGHFISR
jgi:hypothetical protein